MNDFSSIKDQLVTAYNRHATQRDSAQRQEWKIRERGEFLAAVKDAGLTSLLEIGAGPGHDAKFFQEEGLQVTCIDMSPKMEELCRNKGLNAYAMDFSHLTFADNSFDAIWALNCLLHVPKAELPGVLEGIHRILRPGGLFYMGVYGRHNNEGVWEGDTYEPKRFFSFFNEDTLRSVLETSFTILSFKTLPHSEALDFQSIVMRKG